MKENTYEMGVEFVLFLALIGLNVGAFSSFHRTLIGGGRKRTLSRSVNHLDTYSSSTALGAAVEVVVKEGPFNEDFIRSVEGGWWQRRPMLIRNAFDVEYVNSVGGWPELEDSIQLASDEDADTRLITYSKDEGYQIELGPFEENDVESLVKNYHDEKKSKWSLLVNDVDRFLPSVSDWIDETFPFIPYWRRDDGQISIASKGGGIGLHVDNYDVFLIQTSGTREWRIGTNFISVLQEYECLHPESDIRVLDLSLVQQKIQNFGLHSYTLTPGDVLYLPPRLPHWGIAIDDGCSTFSVGCRAPSGAELLSKLAEQMSTREKGYAVDRIKDDQLVDEYKLSEEKFRRGLLTIDSKEKAKQLIRNTVEDLLENEDEFDKWFGALVTEPKRLRVDYPSPMVLDEKCDGDLLCSPSKTMEKFMKSEGFLHHAEGLTFSYSVTECGKCQLYVNGDNWECDIRVARILGDKKHVRWEEVENIDVEENILKLFEDLIGKGFLYWSEE